MLRQVARPGPEVLSRAKWTHDPGASSEPGGPRLPKTNNFDLIRLAAAFQVALTHAVYQFDPSARSWPLHVVLDLFPGVPIFFFISGFLISHSYERHPSLPDFARNRALRIYPALMVCFALAVLSVWGSGYFDTVHVPPTAWVKWFATQLTIAQFYGPAFMRGYGMGILNASTWTISIELQFYVLVPLLYGLLRLQRLSRNRSNAVLVVLAITCMVINIVWVHAPQPGKGIYALIGLTCLPWLYMFLTGVLLQRNFDLARKALGGRFLPAVLLYGVLGLIAARELHWRFNNDLNPVVFTSLALVTFAAAFTAPSLADRVLRRNDLSYGLYLYHAPVINLLLYTQAVTGLLGVLATLTAALVLAAGSWWLIERPALALRRHPAYSHSAGAVAPRAGHA